MRRKMCIRDRYYVEFDKHYKEQVRELVAAGQSEDEAKRLSLIHI